MNENPFKKVLKNYQFYTINPFSSNSLTTCKGKSSIVAKKKK